MNGWSKHRGKAVCLNIDNIDTDQLIPARFMSQPRADGYAQFLLHDVRRDQHGVLRLNFILNQYTDASVLLTGSNFGSGSSREAAVYALLDSGIKVVISQSFGDIFSANAVNNGVLPALVTEEHWSILYQCISTSPIDAVIDLTSSSIRISNNSLPFIIDEARRQKLINGWDDTDITQQYQAKIAAFRQARLKHDLWAWPATKQQ